MGFNYPPVTYSIQDHTLTDGGAKVFQNDDLERKGTGNFANITIHLVSYSQ